MKLLVRKEQKHIDLYDGFFAEVVKEELDHAKTKFDLYISYYQCPEVRLQVASSHTNHVLRVTSDKQINDILLQADNYKEAWERKIRIIDYNIKRFK